MSQNSSQCRFESLDRVEWMISQYRISPDSNKINLNNIHFKARRTGLYMSECHIYFSEL